MPPHPKDLFKDGLYPGLNELPQYEHKSIETERFVEGWAIRDGKKILNILMEI